MLILNLSLTFEKHIKSPIFHHPIETLVAPLNYIPHRCFLLLVHQFTDGHELVFNNSVLMNLTISCLCFFWCMAILPTCAQINKGKKLFEQQEFEAALEAFKNDLERPTNQPIALAEIARIYGDDRYPEKDLIQAYQFVSRALRKYQQLSSTDKKKVQNRGVSQMSLNNLQNDLLQRGYQNALDAHDLSLYNNFLKVFKTASSVQRKVISMKRDELVYSQAKSINTYAAFKDLLDKYGTSLELYNSKQYRQLQKDLLKCYIAQNGWQLYPQFEVLYPDNLYVRDSEKAYEFLNAHRKHTLKAYQEFIRAYPRTPFVSFAKDGIYTLTMQGEDLNLYDHFVRKYEDYDQINFLWKRFYQLYVDQRGTNSVLVFAKAYPSYPFPDQLETDKQQVQTVLEKPLYEQILATEDILLVLDFLKQYPKSSYLPQLELPFYKSLQKKPLIRGVRTFLKHYPKSIYYDAVLVLYYDELVKDGELSTLNQFMMEHPEYKDVDRQQKDLVLAEQGAQLQLLSAMPNGHEAVYETYIKAAAPRDRAFVALQRRLEPLILKKDYPAALAVLQRLAPHFGTHHPHIQALSSLLQTPTPSPPIPLDQGLLSDVTVDGNQLLFSISSKLVKRHKNGSKWSEGQPTEDFTNLLEQGAQLEDISADGQLSLWQMTKDNGIKDLHYSIKQGTQWSAIQPLEPFGKTIHQQLDGYIATGAEALLFASNQPNKLLHPATTSKDFHGNTKGNLDLFVLLRQERGQWSAPINLGDIINTPYEERHPVLHPDGQTLYFCSDGHGGLGRLDVYRCTRLDDTWTRWSTPENLGPLVNSPFDDCPQGIALDNKHLYWTQVGSNQTAKTFYHVTKNLTPSVKMDWVTCQIINAQHGPTPGTIVWQSETTQGVPYHHRTPSGTAVIPVDQSLTYRYWVEQPGSWGPAIYTRMVNVENATQFSLRTYTVSDLLVTPITLFDATTTIAQQEAELTRLVNFLQQEQLRVLLPKKTNTPTGQLSPQAVEALLLRLGCPKKHFSWYSSEQNIKSNTGLLVRFESIPIH